MNRTVHIAAGAALTAAVLALTWRLYGLTAAAGTFPILVAILVAMIGAWDREHDGHAVAQATAIHRPAPTTTDELAAALAGGGDPWDIAYVKELEL